MPIDYSKYPPDWKQIVERIRLRSRDHCEFCNIQNKSTIFSVPLKIQDGDGRYKQKRFWFTDYWDAYRLHGNDHFINTVKVVLTVAHLDHDEENWEVEDERLVHLCQLCHLRYDAKEKYKRSLKKWKKQTYLFPSERSGKKK